MKILAQPISLQELTYIAETTFGDLVKAVVDVESGAVAIDAELHSDLEALLLENGSQQKNLWGINLYPQAPVDDFVVFDSMINVRPSQGNRSRGVENPQIRQAILSIITRQVAR